MSTRMSGRFMVWDAERPVPGETSREARERRARNAAARSEASAYNGAVCSSCGHVRANVVHETDPATSPEGAAYHEGWEHHEFVGDAPDPISGNLLDEDPPDAESAIEANSRRLDADAKARREAHVHVYPRNPDGTDAPCTTCGQAMPEAPDNREGPG